MALPRSAEVVVVGGGLAGAGAACLLAQAGRQVLLLEREAGPTDKICGEFLSGETQNYLRKLGLDLDALGGQRTRRLRLVRNNKVVETKLPFAGLGLSRRCLDEALLHHAEHCGAMVRRGHRISLTSHQGPIQLATPDGATVTTENLFLATGKHDLRTLRRQSSAAPENLVGFKMYFELTTPQSSALQDHVELVLFAHGYAGLQLIEGGRVNLCLLVERAWLLECGGSWEDLLLQLLRDCPHLQLRLHDATPLLQQPLSIYRVPYGFVHSPSHEDPRGIYRLGDQMGVISSFTGDGMGIALHSAAAAADSYLAGLSADTYHRQIRHDIVGQISRADLLYRTSRSLLGQHLLMGLASLYPRSLGLAAKLTRIPAHALARATRQQ